MFRSWVTICPVVLAFRALGSCTTEYDFIIIGGGTAGLTVANRLSELANITIAVIEAGADEGRNPNVTDPSAFSMALGTHVDWLYESTNQTFAAGQKLDYHSGKALGGTSTINAMVWVRAEKSQIDSWGEIGNPGWSWDELLPYYLKTEEFNKPVASQATAGATFDPEDHGYEGYLKVGYPYTLMNGSFHKSVQATWQDLGIPHNLDANGGQVRGFTVWQSSVDRDANMREDATRGYYYSVQKRSNLIVLLRTIVNKILWSNSTCGNAEAVGVEFTSSNGSVSTLKSRRGVIVSAGTLRSPAILELSGIGNPSILSKHGIPVKVELSAVGENLQDQPNTVMAFSSNTNMTLDGLAPYVAYASLSDFFTGSTGNASLKSWAEKVSNANHNSVKASSLEYLFGIQSALLQQGVPDAEIVVSTFPLGGKKVLVSAFWLLMPYSRGGVHIASSDPSTYPAINPNYFLVNFDTDVQVAIAKWTRKFWETEPMKSIATEVLPGLETVPMNATDTQWAAWIKSTFTANSHPLGTAAMMPRELGGVVDHRLKVYGTKNVYVVDASVMPFQVSGHLTSTIYAIAEKAADMIKEDLLAAKIKVSENK